MDPLAPITVSVAEGTLDAVRMTNPAGEEIPGTLAEDRRTWTVATELAYGRTYTLTSTATNVAGVAADTVTSFTTVEPNNLTLASIFPRTGDTVGVAQPIDITFDEPIVDKAAAEAAITITTTPAQEGGFRWVTDEEVHWRPREFWQAGTAVQVDVKTYGRNLGDGLYGQEDSAAGFTIGRSMIFEVDDRAHQMLVKQDGQLVMTIPVSLGRDKWPTYNGVHVVAERYDKKIMDSSTWGLTGTGAYRTEVEWATRISSSGEFVHSAPWSVEEQGVENVSHGCINVSPEHAKWFYDTALRGDPVIITNTKGPNLELWDGYGDWQLPFEQYVGGAGY